MNRWSIPSWLEEEVRERDKDCVYCGVKMFEKIPQGGSRRNVATWEHIINDVTIITRENIARCCTACNSSKGAKDLGDWLQSHYCRIHGITENTVAEVVKEALNTAKKKRLK
jgi:5-methylcytosine-specific restriction endonuclease McrA